MKKSVFSRMPFLQADGVLKSHESPSNTLRDTASQLDSTLKRLVVQLSSEDLNVVIQAADAVKSVSQALRAVLDCMR